MRFRSITSRISAFFKTDRGKSVLKWGQRLVNIAVLGWLVWQLSVIGWIKVWQSFPTQPLFYLLFVLLFFQLPLFEILIYRITWTFNAVKSVPIFLLKRVYNKDVLGYSGEVYFFVWAKNTLNIPGSEIFKIIKDNNIISSIASTLMSIGLLSLFLFTDQIKMIEWIAEQNRNYFIGGVLLVIIIIFLFVKFRHYVISMQQKTAYKIFGIQMVRLLLVQTINLLMYYVVFPDIPFYIWFTYIALEIILSRIPFLPNRDLIFAAMSIALASDLAISRESIAGIMIAKSVLNKIGSFGSFGLSSLFKQSAVVPNPEQNREGFSKIREQMRQTDKEN